MPTPRYTKIVAGLPATVPFVGPEVQERNLGRPFRARLGANESVFGPSPKAVTAMQKAAAEEVWKYCDPENYDLKLALARHHGVKPENIVVGPGIDGLFGSIVRLLTEPGLPVVTSLGAYPTFNYHVAGYGGRLVTRPYRNDREDIDALLEAARAEQPPLVFLANPDNPMGSWWGAADVQRLIDALPGDTVLCLDEAYSDFAPADALPALDVSNSRVIRTRTFSKAYGMAGARVGYAIGEASLIKSFDKIRDHFGVNKIAQVGALAAIADQSYLRSVVSQVETARIEISRIAAANGLKALPSATNFVAIDCGRDGNFARAVLKAIIERGVFVRMPGVAPLDRCIRISAGRPKDLAVLAEVLPEALAAVRG